MKRFHVHVNVADLAASVRYYQTLFGCPPSVHQRDYAKWMLEDPRVNFALSQRGRDPGIDHLGIQVEEAEELALIGARLAQADAVAQEERATTCCYARSDKYWSEDPQGLRWESFRSLGTATTYYGPASAQDGGACCGPAPMSCTQGDTHAASASDALAGTPCCGPARDAAATPSGAGPGCCA